MNNTNESIGLRVLDVSPDNRSSNVNVNSDIKITFTADINPQTFIKNIVVLKDYNHIFKDINSLKDYSQYSVVKGSISYKDRVLTFTPEEQFDTDTCYIVVLNDGITDITGIRMIKKHVSCFYTEAIASFPRCEIISPKYGCITDEVPIFQWKNQCSESYIFQISKSNTFELLLYNKVIDGNKITTIIEHKPDIKLEEGLYHVRVKSENGEWSDTHQIFIKPIVDAIVSSQDAPEMMMFKDFFEGIEEPLEILEYFPPQDNVNISLKTNVIYIKIKGKIDEYENFKELLSRKNPHTRCFKDALDGFVLFENTRAIYLVDAITDEKFLRMIEFEEEKETSSFLISNLLLLIEGSILT